MNILWTDRKFATLKTPRLLELTERGGTLNIDGFSCSAVGGPKRARLSSDNTETPEEYLRLLRYGITITQDTKPVWWGYVSKIRAGGMSVSLDGLWNYVRVNYTDENEAFQSTEWVSDNVSVLEFGNFIYVAELEFADETTAEARRDVFLTQHSNPVVTLDPYGGDGVQIECTGWAGSLEWQGEEQLVAGTPADWTDYAKGQLTGSYVQYLTAGTVTAGGQIITPLFDWLSFAGLWKKWGEIGYTDGRRGLYYVNSDRTVDIYPEPTEAVTHTIDRFGNLYDSNNRIVEPEKCKTGVWATLRNVPSVAGGLAMPRPGFIEEAEWSAADGKTRYRFANVPDPFKVVRLTG